MIYARIDNHLKIMREILYYICAYFSFINKITLFIKICSIYRYAYLFVDFSYLFLGKNLLEKPQKKICFMES